MLAPLTPLAALGVALPGLDGLVDYFTKKRLVAACVMFAVVGTLALLLGPFELRYGIVGLAVLGAAVTAYIVRGVRRIARRTAATSRTLGSLQKLLREHGAQHEATVGSLTALASQDRFELITVLDSQGKAVEAVSGELTEVRSQLTHVEQRLGAGDTGQKAIAADVVRLAKTVDELHKRTTRLITTSEQSNFAQVEALLELRDLLPPRAPMPAMRGWAAAPTTLVQLIQAVLDRGPELVVECGSGVSSIWVGYALEKLGGGRCVALEHEPQYAEATRRALERHGLSSIVEVRDAPLRPVDVSGETFDWYDQQALEGLRDAGVVFVDGPPGATGPLARFPAVPLLGPVLSGSGALFVLDDADRPEERDLQERWCAGYGARVLGESKAEKGWSVLALPQA
jgi:predicted O-methyltransferase YrrM